MQLLLDGMRPLAPNFLYVGMMVCKKPKPLQGKLAEFVEGAKEHGGVVVVSFGYVAFVPL